MTKKLRFEREK